MAKFVADCGGLKTNKLSKAEFEKLMPKKDTKKSSSDKKGKK